MSDEGEKTCPLCAEEMDLTDQQLKPCKCGYEICVWCWHHIMDMAEKDETEGRCPACRIPYDKQRIVGMAAKCERLVAEVGVEKKQKSQKAKVKTSESRKQLSSVRVIQRNLVYIVGLPLNFADEHLLQRAEYFGQYGKVLKVSISRTSSGSIQQFANNTCSVYITYSKEEEAVCCIQLVHGFILDGRPLRACFGTTKYCHAWLRNVPCSNPDCLYLHEIGSQDDSFTKDEIISAYTRVQQITGVTNNIHRRSGSVLPPPPDDYCNNSSAVIEKPVPKSSSNNSASSTRSSPPTSSSGRSGALPPAASWGARASSCNQPAASLACSNGPAKQKVEVTNGPPALSATVSGPTQASMMPSDVGKKLMLNEDTHSMQNKNKLEMRDAVKLTSQSSCPLEVDSNNGECSVPQNATHSIDGQPCSPVVDRGGSSIAGGEKLCSEISMMSIGEPRNGEHFEDIRNNGLCLDNFLSPRSQNLQWHDSEKLLEHPRESENLTSETEDDFDSQRLSDAIVINQTTMPTSSPLHLLSHLRGPLQQHADVGGSFNFTVNPPNVSSTSIGSNGFVDNFFVHASGQGNSCLLNDGQRNNQIGRLNGKLANVESQTSLNLGESSIISNILDLDSWEESLTSPQNLAKLLGETDKPEGPTNLASSWKGQTSNQSRFSFARQEESRNRSFDFESLASVSQATNNHSFGQLFGESRDPYPDRLVNGFGFPQRNIEPSDNLTSGHYVAPSSKLSFSRSQISAPPGFSAPSRPPPPGFPSYERSDQTFDLKSGSHHLLETSSSLRNPYQASPSGNILTANDIEFIDPAILAVGKGRLPSGFNNSSIDMRQDFHQKTPSFENEQRLQLLMQRSPSPHQNLRYSDVRDNFFPQNDAYGINSRHMEQSQARNLSPFSQFSHQQARDTVVSNGQFSHQQARDTVVSNGHWDGWSERHAPNDLDMAEFLRNDRLGFNKFYGNYQDSKFRMTNAGDLHNRSFGM